MSRQETNGIIFGLVALVVVVAAGIVGTSYTDGSESETSAAPALVDYSTPPDPAVSEYRRLQEEQRARTLERIQERYPQAEERLVKAVVRAAYANRVNAYVLASMAQEESSWRTDVVSHKGAIGLLQVKLSTAHIINPYISIQDLKNPWLNADVGAAYLRRLRDRHNLSWEEAVRSYNAGPTRARRNQRIGMGYTQRVHRRAAR